MKLKLICKTEALNDDGSKIMNFTKGEVYEVYDREPETCLEDEDYLILDDYGVPEFFFSIDIMFEVQKKLIN
jgi:hypothetical protein